MDKNIINDIYIKLQDLTKKYELLEIINNKNKENILNLNKQLNFLRKEYKEELNELKDNYIQQYNHLFNIISQNKSIGKENYEIIIVDKNNDLETIKKKFKEDIRNLENKIEDLKLDIYYYYDKSLTNNQNDDKINNFKGTNIEEIFENKLINIFFSSSKNIPLKDLKDIKKLGYAILIKNNKIPLDFFHDFYQANIYNNKNKINEFTRLEYEGKRSTILSEIEEISLKTLIDTPYEEVFIKEFKEKYGILEGEIGDKELKKEYEKNEKNEIKMLEAVLKKLKYLK